MKRIIIAVLSGVGFYLALVLPVLLLSDAEFLHALIASFGMLLSLAVIMLVINQDEK